MLSATSKLRGEKMFVEDKLGLLTTKAQAR